MSIKKPNVISQFVHKFSLKKDEFRIYEILSKKPMTIKQIQKLAKVSEKTLRTYLKDLIKKGFVRRKIVEDERLKYKYFARSEMNILESMHKTITQHIKKTRKEIIKGSKF
jgi:predicted DNA-binding transcriptional regulator